MGFPGGVVFAQRKKLQNRVPPILPERHLTRLKSPPLYPPSHLSCLCIIKPHHRHITVGEKKKSKRFRWRHNRRHSSRQSRRQIEFFRWSRAIVFQIIKRESNQFVNLCKYYTDASEWKFDRGCAVHAHRCCLFIYFSFFFKGGGQRKKKYIKIFLAPSAISLGKTTAGPRPSANDHLVQKTPCGCWHCEQGQFNGYRPWAHYFKMELKN
jgi:hypothetical protein